MSIFNRIVDAWLSARVGPVRQSVTRHNGFCSFPFSQCQPPVSTWLASSASLSPEAAGGICSAMSSHWIYHHARDSSLWSWLYINGNVPNAGRLNQLMMAQAISMTAPQGQDAFEEGWLRNNGVARRQKQQTTRTMPIPALGIRSEIQGQHLSWPVDTPGSANELARAITSGLGAKTRSGKLAGSYKRISISSRLGAHCMAAWVGDDVCFFDPNFGEFYFESADDFSSWFANEFWRQTTYSLILNGRSEVAEYSPVHRFRQ